MDDLKLVGELKYLPRFSHKFSKTLKDVNLYISKELRDFLRDEDSPETSLLLGLSNSNCDYFFDRVDISKVNHYENKGFSVLPCFSHEVIDVPQTYFLELNEKYLDLEKVLLVSEDKKFETFGLTRSVGGDKIFSPVSHIFY